MASGDFETLYEAQINSFSNAREEVGCLAEQVSIDSVGMTSTTSFLSYLAWEKSWSKPRIRK